MAQAVQSTVGPQSRGAAAVEGTHSQDFWPHALCWILSSQAKDFAGSPQRQLAVPSAAPNEH